MRRFPIGIFIIVLSAVMLFLGWRIYGPGEMGRFDAGEALGRNEIAGGQSDV